MFAYDDGTGVDFPVRNEEEWDHFLDILRNEKSVNGEVNSSSTRQPSYLLAPGSTTSCCSLQGDGRGFLPRNDPPVEIESCRYNSKQQENKEQGEGPLSCLAMRDSCWVIRKWKARLRQGKTFSTLGQ